MGWAYDGPMVGWMGCLGGKALRFTHSWPAITLHVLREWLRFSKLQVVLEVVIVFFLFLCSGLSLVLSRLCSRIDVNFPRSQYPTTSALGP